MDIKYFPLGSIEDNRLVKIFRIIFGVVCLGIAIYWLNFNYKSVRSDWTLWITIIFLSAFGFYQIWAGMGKAARYISIGAGHILLKKSSVLPQIKYTAGEIEKLEIFPLSIVFFLGTGKKNVLRFGTINYETNERIVDELIRFAESNNIPWETKEEVI